MYLILERENEHLRALGEALDAAAASRQISHWLFETGATMPDGSRVDLETDSILLKALPVPDPMLPVGTRAAFAAYLLRADRIVDVRVVVIEKWALVNGNSASASKSPVGTSKTTRRRTREK